MKVALIKVPATYADWYKRPLLSISYICAYLEHKGIACKIFDAYFNGWSDEELLHHVEKYKPDLIGITTMTHEVVKSAQIGFQLKKKLNVPIAIGGCHVTALPKKTMEEFSVFDYGVYGEGEYTFFELLLYLQKAKLKLSEIKGLIFREDNGNICINESRPFLTSKELDALPYPAFHQYYDDNSHALAGKNSQYILLTSRGCPYSCAFCMRVLGKKVRRRSAKNVIQEIEYAISQYSAYSFDFLDEIFLFDDKHTCELLQLMIERGLSKRIKWRALIRVNFVNSDIINLAKKAGCYRLGMGVESGDDEILKGINKNFTVEQVRKAVEVIKEARISLETFYILGHPDETEVTLQKTVNLAIELNTETIAVGLMVPYPGTRIYDMAIKGERGYRLVSNDWSQFDKYGGKALEIKNLPYDKLARWQKRTLIFFYIKNFRFIDIFKYFWIRKKALLFFMKKYMYKKSNYLGKA